MVRFAQANEVSVVEDSVAGPVIETLTDAAGRLTESSGDRLAVIGTELANVLE